MKLLQIVFLSVVWQAGALAQHTVSGRVIGAGDKQPLPFANVFLSNTTRGTVTNDKGEFTLTQVPAGTQELVVSYVGFQTQTRPIRTDSAQALLISLQPVADNLAEVKIKSRKDKFWRQHLEVFKAQFLGTGPNARQTEILNPDVIWILEDSTKQWLNVGAREPLLIRNEALGYQIKYQLEVFAYSEKQQYVSYVGYPVFEELSSQSAETTENWHKNRDRAYYGSLVHFFRSLKAQHLDAEGYEVHRMADPGDSPLNAMIMDSKKWSKAEFPKYARYFVSEDRLNEADLLHTRLSTPAESVTRFSGAIQVLYRKELETVMYSRQNVVRKPQSSILEMLGQAVRIQPNGQFFPALDVLVSGSFANDKLADAVPFDYQPYQALK
jgi:hypothetical protein